MRKLYGIFLFVFFFGFLTAGFSFADSARRKGFLSHGPSAAAFGAGETVFSAQRDAAVIQYNPSLMAYFGQNILNVSRFNLYEGSSYNSGSAVLNYLKVFQLGFSVSNLSSGDIEIRKDLHMPGKTVSADIYNYVFAGAGMIKSLGLAYGISVKYLYYDLYEKKGGALAADAGLARVFKGPELFGSVSGIRLGFSAHNIVSEGLKLDKQKEEMPLIYRIGSAFTIPVYYRFQSLDSAGFYADLKYEDSFVDIHAGLSYTFADKYSLKAGYYPGHFTFGFGADFYFLTVDYAADFSDIDLVNRFGLSYRWGLKKAGELEKEAKEALDKEKMSLNEAEKKFKQAKKLYAGGEYLRATDMLSAIVVSYPNFESPMHFYAKMQSDMNKISVSEEEFDFSKNTYAKGYCAYYGADYRTALTEWNKYTHFTGGSEEIGEYMEKINTVMKMQELARLETELDAKAGKMLASGIEKYNASKWVLCIKTMEKLQKFVTDNKFSKTLEYYNKAKKYIDKSVEELAKTIKYDKKTSSDEQNRGAGPSAEDKFEIDEASADKKYNEGLILYAQGKYFEAERTWELTLRLNPKHRKAKIALSKLRESGYLTE